MFRKLFLDHPRAVKETYGQHWYVANRFGLLMILAGLGTMLHGFLPGVMTRTGSNMVRKLHGEMMRRQPGNPQRSHSPSAVPPSGWQLEYEI
ncbi:DUF6356 family protein [Novosphingobium sp. BL-8H]|uniref:DUF6356 family protein n=1 Tax=Novosphingobium sp. BL-8H TaxID=3127640 RepID=UPI003756450C